VQRPTAGIDLKPQEKVHEPKIVVSSQFAVGSCHGACELRADGRARGCPTGGRRDHALPLSGQALATLAIFAFLGQWNSFLWPLIVTNSEKMRTLPVRPADI
jgi:hypothetical protein